MNPLKVLVLPSWYPTIDDPINGIFFKEQSESLNQYANVAVLYLNPVKLRQPKNFLFTKRKNIEKINGLLTYELIYEWIPRNVELRNKVYEMKLIKGYLEIIKMFGVPDIIHAHVTYPAGYGALILSKKFNIPFIVTEHATFFDGILMKKYNYYAMEVLKQSDYYIAVSSSLKDRIISTGRRQCEIVPNFVNIDKFSIDYTSKKEIFNKFNLINISIMTEKKGIDILLKSINKIVFEANYKNIHLHLVGDGPNKEEYVNMAKEMNLIDYCTFYGRLDDNELVQKLFSSDALVISSRTETFGVTGIEAMACGLPVISTRCGGPEDYITDKVGILVENENVDSLSEGIIELISNYDKYDANDIRKYVHDNYSAKVICERIIDIYKNVISSK